MYARFELLANDPCTLMPREGLVGGTEICNEDVNAWTNPRLPGRKKSGIDGHKILILPQTSPAT